MKTLFWTVVTLLISTNVMSQPVVAPTRLDFTHEQVDFDKTEAYHIDFYQCGIITNNTCQNRSVTSFQGGIDVLKANVASSGNIRTIFLNSLPIYNQLGLGLTFVGTLIPMSSPLGNGPKSIDSNMFKRGERPPGPPLKPGTPIIK